MTTIHADVLPEPIVRHFVAAKITYHYANPFEAEPHKVMQCIDWESARDTIEEVEAYAAEWFEGRYHILEVESHLTIAKTIEDEADEDELSDKPPAANQLTLFGA